MVFAVCHDSNLSMKQRRGELRRHQGLALAELDFHPSSVSFASIATHGHSMEVPTFHGENEKRLEIMFQDATPKVPLRLPQVEALPAMAAMGTIGNLWNGSVNETKLKEVFSFLITLW